MASFYIDVSVLDAPAEGSELADLDQSAEVAVVDLSSRIVLGVARVGALHAIYVAGHSITRERVIGLVADEPDFALIGEYEGALIYEYSEIQVALRYREVGLARSANLLAAGSTLRSAFATTSLLPGVPHPEPQTMQFDCDDFEHGGPHSHTGPASLEGTPCPTPSCHGTLHQMRG